MADSKQVVRVSPYRLSTIIDSSYTYLLPLESVWYVPSHEMPLDLQEIIYLGRGFDIE